MSKDNPFEGTEVVSVYTRAEAIADGMLVDVTGMAREAGFKLHTVVTRTVWERCVQVPEALKGQGQDEQGRLWDVLWMASLAARRAPSESLVTFKVSVVDAHLRDGSPHRQEHVLWLHIGPGDSGEAALTVMFPEGALC
ncbi:MAG: hypothetical protein HY681_15355 [Chloroflexi bacterium]|nr:hypothetical protein [Chloroflexota bacterium]